MHPPRSPRVAFAPFLPSTAVLAVLALLAGSVAAQAVDPVDPVDPSKLTARVDAIVQRYLASATAVGVSVGIARDGEVVLAKGYGKAELEFGIAADGDTMFRIGSVTKQFTAALILRGVERGQLALDDTLGKVFAAHTPPLPAAWQPVTIRQLLQHRSGIPNYTDAGPPWERQQALEITADELLAFVADRPLDFAPDRDFRYSNTGYFLLGMVLEQLHGKPLTTLFAAEVADPLHLARTRYDSNTELIGNRAQGYAVREGVLGNDDPIGVSQPGAAGALLSTGGDLVRWTLALAGGKVVTPESYAQMTTAGELPSGQSTHYGFGLMLVDLEGHRCVHHGGGINGFNSVLSHFPDDRLVVAVISNSERLSASRVGREIAMALLGVARPVAADRPVEAALLRSILGDYAIADLGMNLRLFEDEGRPRLQAEGQDAFRLLWQGEREFRAEFDHAVKVVFQADWQGFELHQGGSVFLARRR